MLCCFISFWSHRVLEWQALTAIGFLGFHLALGFQCSLLVLQMATRQRDFCTSNSWWDLLVPRTFVPDLCFIFPFWGGPSRGPDSCNVLWPANFGVWVHFLLRQSWPNLFFSCQLASCVKLPFPSIFLSTGAHPYKDLQKAYENLPHAMGASLHCDHTCISPTFTATLCSHLRKTV